MQSEEAPSGVAESRAVTAWTATRCSRARKDCRSSPSRPASSWSSAARNCSPSSSQATGSDYPFPAKSDVSSTEAAHGKVRDTHTALAAADRVLLLGAGPVGIELAGEIKAVWPGKQVTLVDVADDVLGERYRPDLKAELRRQLDELGVELLLGSPLKAEPPNGPGELGSFTVTTLAGGRRGRAPGPDRGRQRPRPHHRRAARRQGGRAELS